MTKKILLLTGCHPYYYERGASFRIHMMVKALTSLGYDTHLVTTHVGKDVKLDNLTIHRTIKLPFLKKIETNYSSPLRICIDFLLFFKAFQVMHRHRCDIIQCETAEILNGGILLKRIFKVPLVYDLHGTLHYYFANLSKFKMKSTSVRIADFIDKLIVNNSDYVIANWNFTKQEVCKIKGNCKTSVIYDRVNCQLEPLKKADLYKEGYIVYAGNFKEYQRVDLLIDAFKEIKKEIKKLKLMIVGPNPPTSLRNICKSKDIVFLGKLPVQETNWVIKNALVAVMPRTGYVFPLKIITYFQMGKAVVAVDIKDSPVFLKDKENVLLCKPDYKDMAKKIVFLVKNKKFREQLEKNTTRISKKMFTDDVVEKELSRIYSLFEKDAKRKMFVFFRDDDIGLDPGDGVSQSLKNLIHIFINEKVPLTLGLVPAALNKTTLAWLMEIKNKYPNLIELCQHGWKHMNYGCKEFGACRNLSEQYNDIANGKNLLLKEFKNNFSLVFIPPSNRFSENTLLALKKAKFKVISASSNMVFKQKILNLYGHLLNKGFVFGFPVSYQGKYRKEGLIEISAQVDFASTYKNGGKIKTKEKILKEVYAHKKNSNIVGIMLHHQIFRNEKDLGTVKYVIKQLKKDPLIEFKTIEGIYCEIQEN